MKTAQQHAQEILPLVTAQANGEVIQMYVCGKWHDCMNPTAFVYGCKYRVKPKMILVNGFEVPEPMSEEINKGEWYYAASVLSSRFYEKLCWSGDSTDYNCLSRGIIHLNKDAAISHAKAMLGIDPNE